MGETERQVAAVDREFQAHCRRLMAWGGWTLVAAVMIWAFLLQTLLFSYGNCKSPNSHTSSWACADRAWDWTWLMALLVASLPIATAGVITYLRGAISLKTVEHLARRGGS